MYDTATETRAAGVCEFPPETTPAQNARPEPAIHMQPADSSARFTGTDVAGYIVFRPTGALTYQIRDEFEAAATQATHSQPRLVLDGRDTMLMDSAFLEMLLDLQDRVTSVGGCLKLVNLNPTCQDIIAVTRLGAALSIYDDLGSAVRRR